jgi:N-acetylglucosaminyl-diphospho-decaprenol L-rhamnosyltransferase
MPTLAIVIVTYNCRAEVHACLRSLAEHPPSVTTQIVVVDNASSDGTVSHIRSHWTGVLVEEPGSNLGFARANNIGIRRSTSELVLLLNPDTLVKQHAIDRLIAAIERDPLAAAAGPRIVDAHGRAELSFGRMISPLAELRQRILVSGNDRGVPWIVRRVDRMTRRAQPVDWVSGACLLVGRHDLEAAGLLDERYFMYQEDVDLCAALRTRGQRILFSPDAEIVHLRGRSAASAPRATHEAYRRSHLAFYRKHHPIWALALAGYLKLRGQYPSGAETRTAGSR